MNKFEDFSKTKIMKRNRYILEKSKIIMGQLNANMFDPLGSYTGASIIDYCPTQDADDL